MRSAPVLAALIGCSIFLIFGFLFKGQCLEGLFNQNAYKNLCYNDLQPLFGPRLHTTGPDGQEQLVFPYVHGYMDDEGLHEGAIEYPVLTGLFMYGTALFAADGDAYLRVSVLFLAPFGLLIAYLLAGLAGWRALLWALAPALGLYAFHNWDLLVVAAAVTGIWFWARGQPLAAATAFGIGAAFKMWPIFFLGPLLLERWQKGSLRSGIVAAATGVGVFAAINLPFALINFEGWWATYGFHQQRGPNFDSIWWVGRPEWSADQVSLVSTALTGAFFLAVLGISWWLGRRRQTYPFLQTCAALLATFLLWNKVHSPQFTLWLLPFFALLRVNVLWWFAYAIADLGVYIGVFRWFHEFGQGAAEGGALDLMQTGVWARAILLLLLVGIFLGAPREVPPDDREPSPGEPAGDPGSARVPQEA